MEEVLTEQMRSWFEWIAILLIVFLALHIVYIEAPGMAENMMLSKHPCHDVHTSCEVGNYAFANLDHDVPRTTVNA